MGLLYLYPLLGKESRMGECALDSCGSGEEPVMGLCENGNEFLDSTHCSAVSSNNALGL